MQYGYLNMVLPFMTVLVTPAICSLADRRHAHRAYFTISLIFTMIALSLFTLLPLLVPEYLLGSRQRVGCNQKSSQQSSDLLLWPWIYFCVVSLLCDLSMGINTCLSDSFAVLQAEEHNTSFGRIIVWGTFGWAFSGLALCLINQSSSLPRLVPGLLLGTFLLGLDVVIVTYWPRGSDFKLDIIPMDAARTLTGSTSLAHREPNDYLPLNESARINLGTEYEEASKSDGQVKIWRKTKSPVEICAETLGELKAKKSEDERLPIGIDQLILSVKTVNSEQDPLPTQKNNESSSSTSGSYHSEISTSPYDKEVKVAQGSAIGKSDQVIELKKETALAPKKQKDKSSGREKRELLTSFSMQITLLFFIMQRRKSLIRYFILFILSGFFMSMHWNYFFLYLEEIFCNKFELISAISMVGQSVLGELPFFILSRKVIDRVGRSHTLSISVISIGIRFLLYGYLLPNASMYYIVLADCFQGPNYGLFYVVMTEVGLEYSYCDDVTIERLAARGQIDRNNKRQVDSVRLSLRSTVQSVAFACYEGVGLGLGSLVGGWIVAKTSFKTLWLVMSFCSIFVGLTNLFIEFTCANDRDDTFADSGGNWTNNEQREFFEARRRGTLKKLASPHPLPRSPSASQARPLSPFKFLQKPQAEVEAALACKAALGGRPADDAQLGAAKPFR